MVSERKVEPPFPSYQFPKNRQIIHRQAGVLSLSHSPRQTVKDSDAFSGYTVLGGLKGLSFIAGRGTSSAKVESPRMSRVGGGEAIKTRGYNRGRGSTGKLPIAITNTQTKQLPKMRGLF